MRLPGLYTGPGSNCGEFDRCMELSATLQCPYCGQAFEITLDTTLSEQRFVTDCEVCCRPLEVFAQCEPGEVLSIDVEAS